MTPRSWFRCNQAGLCFIVALLGLMAVGRSRMMRDPGTLWHTVVGERMIQDGGIVRSDPFSFTHAGEQWIAQQWLGECAMALMHRMAGLDGLLLGACIILAAILAIIASRAARLELPWPVTLLTLLIISAASSYHFMPRPHLATLLFMTLGTVLLCDVESGRVRSRALWWIPPGMLLWTNLHGGALGGLASLVLVALGWLLRPAWLRRPDIDRKSKLSPWLIAGIVSLAAGTILMNPFGAGLPTVWLSLMGSDVLPKVIIEHAATEWLSVEGFMLFLVGAAYFAMLASVWKRGVRVVWLLPMVWFVLAMSRVRHGPIFALSTAVILLDMLEFSPIRLKLVQWAAGRPTAKPGQGPMSGGGGGWGTRWSALTLPACIAVVAFILKAIGAPVPVIGSNWCRLDASYWPVEATAALNEHLERHPEDSRVFNDMLFGGYLIYQAPNARLYIDDRCELYRDPGIRRYVELLKYPDRFAGEAAYRDIRTALVDSRSPIARHLKRDPDWSVLHADGTATLFVRNPTLAVAR